MASKRHHYVPRFYLNYFCSEDLLWVYEKGSVKPRRQAPHNTAVEARLYSFTIDGKKDDTVEQQLSVIESETKPILDRWQQRNAIPFQGERETVALFLALLHVRVPRMLSAIEESVEISAVETMKLAAEHRPDLFREFVESRASVPGGYTPTAEELIDATKNFRENFNVVVNREASVAESLSLAPSLVPYLLDMDWSLWEAPPGKFFLTGDTPLCVFARTQPGRALFGAGFGLSNAEITFPVSARLYLMLRRAASESRGIMKMPKLRDLNARMVATAERYVFSPERSSSIGKMTRRARPNQPKLDRDIFGSEWRRRMGPKLNKLS